MSATMRFSEEGKVVLRMNTFKTLLRKEAGVLDALIILLLGQKTRDIKTDKYGYLED